MRFFGVKYYFMMSEMEWNTPQCRGKSNICWAKLFISNALPTGGHRKPNPRDRYDPRSGCNFLDWVLSERWGKWYLEWVGLLASKTLISLTGLRLNNATHESTPELHKHIPAPDTHTHTQMFQRWKAVPKWKQKAEICWKCGSFCCVVRWSVVAQLDV